MRKITTENCVITKVGKFTFKIPEDSGHVDAGKKVEKPFEYPETVDKAEAESVLASKKWDIKEMVDETLKANARSNAYQAALLPYKPSEVPQEDIKERMIRDYIRLGVPEEAARAQVESMMKLKGSAPTE